MKTTILRILILVLLSSCYGSFKLTSKVHEANASVSENGIVTSVVMVGMFAIPIYPIAAIADILFFNSLEFWSGENPISMKDGEQRKQVIHTQLGEQEIIASKNRIDIVTRSQSGEHYYSMEYDRASGLWRLQASH